MDNNRLNSHNDYEEIKSVAKMHVMVHGGLETVEEESPMGYLPAELDLFDMTQSKLQRQAAQK